MSADESKTPIVAAPTEGDLFVADTAMPGVMGIFGGLGPSKRILARVGEPCGTPSPEAIGNAIAFASSRTLYLAARELVKAERTNAHAEIRLAAVCTLEAAIARYEGRS